MAETRERMRSFEDLGADGVIKWLKERDIFTTSHWSRCEGPDEERPPSVVHDVRGITSFRSAEELNGQNIQTNTIKDYFDVWHLANGISKKFEAASKKRDCADTRSWIKSSVNHCYWVAASCGEDGYLKEQKWTLLTEYVTNKHERCEHGVLEEDRLWIKEGNCRY
uniref:Uncharacterized protein n=1 Tax=Magallana gigas TaxID=29159 RepID=K1PJT1_MAGGI